MKDKIPNSVQIIDSHLDEFFDKTDDIKVLDEIKSEIVHVDVYIIKAKKERPYNILLSSGMSALPMKIPHEIDSSEFAEVMMLLPKEWNLEYDSFNDERNYWPFRIMKNLCKLPHINNTWLGYGHTYGLEEDGEFAKGIGFNSVILLNSIELSSYFIQIELDNKLIDIFSVIPLYKEELAYKKEYGTSELLKKFDDFNISEIVRIGRRNVCN
ncbi:MAG: suppressor of fused domain protein [Calditrichales bacterium]|nr:suppressor of fused domain protein [Calditrichales bacterium]